MLFDKPNTRPPFSAPLGLAHEAVEHIMWFGRMKRKIRRFFVKIGEANLASIQLFETKLGFKRCGYSAAFKEVELEVIFESAPAERPASLVNVRPFGGEGEPVAVPPANDGARPDGAGNPVPALARSPGPRVKCGAFGAVVGDGIGDDFEVSGQVTLLNGCCLVNLTSSGAAPVMGILTVAMNSRFESMPLTSTLLRGTNEVPQSDEVSKVVSRHLTKKLRLQCFVSSSLPEAAAAFAVEIASHCYTAVVQTQAP